MPRIARVVEAGVPDHVTLRGNRRMQTFFSGEDYQLYLDLAAEYLPARGVKAGAYFMMPNQDRTQNRGT